MENIGMLILVVALFAGLTFLFYHLFKGYIKKESSPRKWKLTGDRVYFWQSVIFFSVMGTALVIFILKQGTSWHF